MDGRTGIVHAAACRHIGRDRAFSGIAGKGACTAARFVDDDAVEEAAVLVADDFPVSAFVALVLATFSWLGALRQQRDVFAVKFDFVVGRTGVAAVIVSPVVIAAVVVSSAVIAAVIAAVVVSPVVIAAVVVSPVVIAALGIAIAVANAVAAVGIGGVNPVLVLQAGGRAAQRFFAVRVGGVVAVVVIAAAAGGEQATQDGQRQ